MLEEALLFPGDVGETEPDAEDADGVVDELASE